LSGSHAAAKPSPAFGKLKTVLLFIALGPPVGGVLTFLGMVVYANDDFSRFEPRYILAGFGLLLFVLITSYVSAFIPAALAGIIVGQTTGIGLNGVMRDMMFFAVVGAVVTIAYTACLLGLKMGVDGPMLLVTFISILAFLAVPGALAAMVCGYIALRAGWLTPPNRREGAGKMTRDPQ